MSKLFCKSTFSKRVFNIDINGDLLKRAHANFNRLEDELYMPPNVYKGHEHKWPGDIEGRTILALVLLAQATKREPKYLSQIMKDIPNLLNDKGYFGPVYPEGVFNEQQLSGNSWFLRSMCEYYLWKKDEQVLDIIKEMVKNLLLPARGYYKKYPILPGQRQFSGKMVGNIVKVEGNWYTSTDIGCAFIMLDGATHAYELLRENQLKELIDEMIKVFLSIDLINLSCQTHATLSAVRGLIRYYESTGEEYLLMESEKIYSLYSQNAMTENYANYNWFGRPTWTEPCAVVDSFIVAFKLWQHIGNPQYLNDAHHIWFNAIGHGQRPNGGFGTDLCSGAEDVFLGRGVNKFEATHCCTMRGGEGLSKAVEYLAVSNDMEVIIPFYNDCTISLPFSNGMMTLKESTGYPYEGWVNFEVIDSNINDPKTLKLFIPEWVEEFSVFVNDKPVSFETYKGFAIINMDFTKGQTVSLRFNITLRTEKNINKNNISAYTYRHGSLVLGIDNHSEIISLQKIDNITSHGKGVYRIKGNNLMLSPVNDMIDMQMERAKTNKKQILFK